MRRSVSIPLALAAALTLALSGCSKDDKQSSDGPDNQAGETEEEYDPGPLWEYMGPIWGEEDWSNEQYAEEERKREELIAQCMTDQGFEYKPVITNPIPTEEFPPAENSDEPQWGTIEFAKEFGYGIAYAHLMEPEEPPTLPENEFVDPNQDYLDSLTESEQNAYWQALYGPDPSEQDLIDMENGVYQWTWEKAGCSGYAQHTLHPEQDVSIWDDPEFEELMQAVDAVWQQAQEDPEVDELNAAWADCMAKATYPGFGQPADAETAAWEEFQPLILGPDDEYREPDKASLESFQQYEIPLATADFQCRADVDYEKKSVEIEHKVQQQVLDRYKDQIDAAIAKYGKQ